MPKTIIVGNWKMNTSLHSSEALVEDLLTLLDPPSNLKVVVCPPSLYLVPIQKKVRNSCIHLGAQDMHYENNGAYTGEVSPAMVAELCEYVILGHSERRLHFGETNQAVNKKVEAALRVNLSPIICIGETANERSSNQANDIIASQLSGALTGVEDAKSIVIAYEPVWAIGSGAPATPELANEILQGPVRETLRKIFGGQDAERIPLLYGGSVGRDSISGFLSQPSINGALIGGASLKADDFAEIVHIAAKSKHE